MNMFYVASICFQKAALDPVLSSVEQLDLCLSLWSELRRDVHISMDTIVHNSTYSSSLVSSTKLFAQQTLFYTLFLTCSNN